MIHNLNLDKINDLMIILSTLIPQHILLEINLKY